jgi:uncharacterized protein YcfJ
MRTFLVTLALAAALVPSARARAQDNPEPQPNQRVMLVLTPQHQVEGHTRPQALRGTLVAEDADSLTVQVHPGTGPIRVARSVVRRMYVSRGVPSRSQSAATGAVVGAVGGALWGWIYNPEREQRSDQDAALLGAAAGGGFGLVMGALFPAERWKRVRMPSNVALSPTVSRDGQGLAIHIRF